MKLEEFPKVEISLQSFENYRNAGGILSEADYTSALTRMKEKRTMNPSSLLQAEDMATKAGITLQDPQQGIDPRVALYAILQGDFKLGPGSDKNHYSRMSDQPLFAEVLRMLGDAESLTKFQNAYPNIFPENK